MKPRRIDWSAVDWLDGVAEMPPDERGVYDTILNLIYARAEEDGGIEISEHDLAIRCCCHWRELRRIFAALMTRGKVWQEGRRTYAKKCAEVLQKARTRSARAEQNVRKRWSVSHKNNELDDTPVLRNGNARARAIQSNTQTLKQSEEDKETRATNSRFPAEEFEEFWKLWPNHVGKAPALKAFPKALGKVSLAELLDGVRRYTASTPSDRPWLNPATWLNQERWNDEPSAPGNGKHPGGYVPMIPGVG